MKGLTDDEFEILHRRVVDAPHRITQRPHVVYALIDRGLVTGEVVRGDDGSEIKRTDITPLGRLAYRCELAVRGVRTT